MQSSWNSLLLLVGMQSDQLLWRTGGQFLIKVNITFTSCVRSSLRPGSVILLRGLTGLNMWSYSLLQFIIAKDAKLNQQMKKIHGEKSKGEQVKLTSDLSQWSHARYINFPVKSCDSTEVYPTRKACQRSSAQVQPQRFIPLPGTYPNSRRKAGYQMQTILFP